MEVKLTPEEILELQNLLPIEYEISGVPGTSERHFEPLMNPRPETVLRLVEFINALIAKRIKANV